MQYVKSHQNALITFIYSLMVKLMLDKDYLNHLLDKMQLKMH